MMNARNYLSMLTRDGSRCVHCGTTETLVPQHRINRGSGGPDIPSNIITFCSAHNELIERDPLAADVARAMGWKLRPWMRADLLVLPFYDRPAQSWFYLDDEWHRTLADPR